MKYLIYISLILVFVSCDLFTSRDSEDPAGLRSNFNSPTTPEILFENLASSFNDKVIENYTANFTDSMYLAKNFRFIPAADAAGEFPQLADWSLPDEKQYFTQLVSKVAANQKLGLKLFFNEKTVYVDSAVYIYRYEISTNSDDENIPSFCSGTSQFTINVDRRNFWVISKWQDISDNKNRSWSYLKGKLY
ncbi:MAG: hypothetical protein GXX85_01135 [Ignavibacteria bacterium]|nr:hypothetical protein [Ignavibacteria bacterium]